MVAYKVIIRYHLHMLSYLEDILLNIPIIYSY